jgi:hypothetical protein
MQINAVLDVEMMAVKDEIAKSACSPCATLGPLVALHSLSMTRQETCFAYQLKGDKANYKDALENGDGQVLLPE